MLRVDEVIFIYYKNNHGYLMDIVSVIFNECYSVMNNALFLFEMVLKM
jgi:hypothetical protein